MDKKMIPQKGEGRLFIVLPTLEIMLSSCDNSKMRAQSCRHGEFQFQEALQDADRFEN